MKKAKKVVVPLDRTLTYDEWESLWNHAKKSAYYGVMNYNRTSSQVKQKLFDKGYPKSKVKAITDDGEREVDFTEEVVDYLDSLFLLDDDLIALNMTSKKLSKGYGPVRIRSELYQKGLSEDIVNKYVDNISEEDMKEALNYAKEQILRKSSFKKIANEWDKKRKISQGLAARGFFYSDISSLEEEGVDGY